MSNIKWLWPVSSASTTNITQYFTGPYPNYHSGVDIGISVGTNVVASKSGTICAIFSGCKNNNAKQTKRSCSSSTGCACNNLTQIENIKYCNYGLGNAVYIKHGENDYSQYLHLTNIHVQLGQKVSQGDIIGTSGSTGESDGPHLHFSLSTTNNVDGRYNNNPKTYDSGGVEYIFEAEPAKTTVTFVQYSGGPSSTVDYTPGQAYGTLPASMNRNNFRFLGWFTASSGGTKITASSIVPSSNVTLYGQWKYFSYVTFDENFDGGKTTVKECISGEKYGSVFPAVTSRRNFRFLGWFTERASGDQITSDSIAASYPSYTLYAHWKYFSYVTFDENFEGGKTYVKECISGEPYGHIFPVVSSREGYRFDGWFTEREDGDMITSSTNAASYPSYSLYAHWTKLTKVTLIYNNDSVDPPIIPYLYLTPGEKHGNALPVPQSGLLRFEGWYFTSFIDSSTKVTPDTKVAPGYETLTACWSAPVTFHTTSTGGTFQELWFEVGRKFGKVLPTPVRNSYVFEGWYFTNFVYDSARITADDIVRPMSYNLIAGWSVPTTFDYNYPGGASEVINIIEGARIGAYLPTPTRSGYRLKGWCYVPSDLGVYISPDSKVTSPYTIYAQWDDTVQVTLDNGSIKQENPVISYKIGKSYGELPVPEWNNYRFDGWYYRNPEGEVKITSDSIVPAENHTLFARWSIPNTFNYNYPGGASEVVYIINGDKIGAYLPTPVRDGYRLKGWYYTPNDLNVYLSPDEIITSSYTFYAHWDKQ